MIEQHDHNDPLQRLIANALVPDDLRTIDDAEIEALLDRAQSEPMTDEHVDRILKRTEVIVTEQPLAAARPCGTLRHRLRRT